MIGNLKKFNKRGKIIRINKGINLKKWFKNQIINRNNRSRQIINRNRENNNRNMEKIKTKTNKLKQKMVSKRNKRKRTAYVEFFDFLEKIGC